MKILCCDKCFDKIAKCDTKAARLWLDLCSYNVKLGNIGLREWRVPGYIKALKTLERMGYIHTRDGLEYIQIRVNGRQLQEVPDVDAEQALETFCADRECHGH